MLRRLWRHIQEYEKLMQISSRMYNLFMHNKIRRRKRNKIDNRGAFLKKCKIFMEGNGNTVILEPGVRMQNCVIQMSGDSAVLHIQRKTYVEKQKFHFEDNGCVIRIGKNCVINGGEFAAAENGRKIVIGDDCLFSRDIHIVTTDSHSIVDKDTQKRINVGQDVEVGNCVWLTAGVTLLKGSGVASGCVVGRNTVVTKKMEKENGVIAGYPGKYIKENIEWKAERL